MAERFASVILDNEAVVALFDTDHRKHRDVLPYMDAVATRRRRESGVRVYVPVAVRVEAGWDRTAASASVINRVAGAEDVPLSGDAANHATRLVQATRVSVVDATVAVTAAAVPHPVAILTSDTDDMERLKAEIGGDVRVIRI